MDPIIHPAAPSAPSTSQPLPTDARQAPTAVSMDPKDRVALSPSGTSGDAAALKMFPQDPVVSAPEPATIPKAEVGTNLQGPRVISQDPNNPKAIADPDGNFFYDAGTPQFDQVNAHAVVNKTLDMYQGYIGHNIPWAFSGDQLSVHPHKQEGMNAYYSRWEEAVNFFYFPSKALNKTVQTSESVDVVSHETGHAVLDGLKPGLMNSFSTEAGAFHEAFGDVSAMLVNLQIPSNVDRVLAETGGDLKKPNNLAWLAEEFGRAIHVSDSDPKNDRNDYLRTAQNHFTYVPPNSLPSGRGDDNTLTGEPHSFSRLFSGASYDAITGIYEANRKAGQPDKEALVKAGNTFGRIFVRGVELSPPNSGKYKDIAAGMISADKELFGGANAEVLKDVFSKRKILTGAALRAVPNTDNPPALRLPAPVASNDQAQAFLDRHRTDLKIPEGIALTADRVDTKDDGSQVLSYTFSRDVQLDGPEYGKYQGYAAPVQGGLTLAFDKGGTLIHRAFQDITADDVAATRQAIKALIDQGLIAEGTPGTLKSIFKDDGSLFKAIAVKTPAGDNRIERIPIAFD